MKKMKKLISLLLALCMVLALAACGSGDTADSSSAESSAAEDEAAEDLIGTGGTTESTVTAGEAVQRDYAYGELVIGTLETSGGFDRVESHGSHTLINVLQAWDALFVIDPTTKEVVPQMVDSYEWADDYLSLTLTLKDNIYAADGEKITAEDVIWSMERNIVEQGVRSSYYEAYDFDTTWANLEDPEALTFTLYYKYEYGPGLSYLIDPVYPKDWGTEGEGASDAAWWDSPDSTGPYVCVENTDSVQTVFELRDDYYMDTTGYPTKITIKFYSEATALYIDYANGVLDAAFELAATDMENLIDGQLSDTTYYIAPKNDVYAICLTPYTEYFQDENVRLAIAHALDLDAIGYAALGVMSKTATSTLPSGVNYYEDVGGYEYDPELAKEYLAKSAYPDGFSLEFQITDDSESKAIAEMLQFYLGEIGIDVTFQAYAIPTAVPTYFISGVTPILIKNCMEGAPSLDPDQIYDTIGYKSTNKAAMVSSDPDDYFNTNLYGALNSADPEVRAEMYANVQEYLHDTAWQIPVCEGCVGYCFRNDYITSLDVVAPTTPNLRYVRFVDEAAYNGE